MYTIQANAGLPKAALYEALRGEFEALIAGETDWIANLANASALIYHTLPEVNWAGFYLFKQGALIVGPFQGKPACVRIDLGKGVCGTAAAEKRTIVIQNVHEFPGHIACDTASNAEIVVPMLRGDELLGVLDIDSPIHGRFDEEDRRGLEAIIEALLRQGDGRR